MPTPSTALRFALRLLVVYGLLIAPWPGLKSGYGSLFRTCGNKLIQASGLRDMVEFRPPTVHQAAWDVEMHMKNPKTRESWHVEFRSHGWGYLPTAAIVALIVATPLAWSRRWMALIAGLVLVQLFIALRVAVLLLFGMYWGGAIHLSEVQAKAAEIALEGFSNSPVATFIVPVVIWLLVTFRRSDLEAILPRSAAEAARQQPATPRRLDPESPPIDAPQPPKV